MEMTMYKMLFVILSLLCFQHAAYAEDCDFDPLERNLIFVQGKAELWVPVNGLRFKFGFDVNKGSFESSNDESQRIITAIEEVIKSLNLTQVKVVKGWDLVSQGKISIGEKGRKISNHILIETTNFPQAKMHTLIARIIDQVIAVDSSIQLENLHTFLTEDLETNKGREVVLKAMHKFKQEAELSAETLGRSIAAPKRIYISETGEKFDEDYDESLFEPRKFSKTSSFSGISVQKSFVVNSELDDNIKVSAFVHGIYQLD